MWRPTLPPREHRRAVVEYPNGRGTGRDLGVLVVDPARGTSLGAVFFPDGHVDNAYRHRSRWTDQHDRPQRCRWEHEHGEALPVVSTDPLQMARLLGRWFARTRRLEREDAALTGGAA